MKINKIKAAVFIMLLLSLQTGCHGIQRWMCLVLTVLRVLISQSKEEVILSRLQELGLLVSVPCRHGDVAEQQSSETMTSDDDEDQPPEETFARSVTHHDSW